MAALGGGRLAVADMSNRPRGVAALGGGRLAVADMSNHRVVVVDAATGAFERIIGSVGGADGQFNLSADGALFSGA